MSSTNNIRNLIQYDPVPWLMKQKGLAAVRARRLLGLEYQEDEATIATLLKKFAAEQLPDGSFEQSPMKTAGILNLLDDLKTTEVAEIITDGASYLISILESQPGYSRAGEVEPGSLNTPIDLCGFFGPYEDRSLPEVLAYGAREMNFYREYEPLLGPKSPVRNERRSSLDRVGPASCYSWGLIPLCYTIESLCRAGYAQDERVQPAINVLLGVQRESGGWCRNLGGHPNCSVHGVRALGSHPELRKSEYSLRALELVQRYLNKINRFVALQVVSAFDLPMAREIIHDILAAFMPRQQKNGTFGSPCRIERVAAVFVALKSIEIG